jgi:mannose-6-phosphate isomerase-like protein (cupin superfamily)
MMRQQTAARGQVFHPGEGTRAWWFLGSLMTLKAGADDTAGSFTLLEQHMPAGFAPPRHVHLDEEEVFAVFEGRLRVTCGAQEWLVGPGDTVFLPRGVAHGFEVVGDEPARIWHLTAPAKFERFVAEIGVPADSATLPPPSPVDVPKVVRTGAAFGYEILPGGD